jgi:hypothetical protein
MVAIAVLAAQLPAYAAPPSPTWELTTAISIDNADGDRFDVRTRDGYIIVTTDHQVSLKLFSILGQLISQQTLQPGVWRLKVKARGIYILKTDTVTRRVTV